MPLNPGAADFLTTPPAPTVVQNAVGASAAITYSIVFVNASGQDSIPSPTTVTGANNASTANNTLSWAAQAGVIGTRILKNGNLLATVGPGVTSYTDSAGSAGIAYTAYTANPTAMVPSTNSPIDGGYATYSASMQALVAVTGCTDLFTIYGSATKTVKVTKVTIVGTTITTPIVSEVQLIKRSSVNTTGTSSAPTNLVAYDSNSPAATATVLGYTANPGGLGTVAGIISASKIILNIVPTSTLDVAPDRYIQEFGGGRPSQCPTLRGVAQGLCVNLVATAFSTAATFDVAFEWCEF